MLVSITAITIPANRLREVGNVDALAESMEAIGLLNPIVLTKENTLIAGAHRLEAAKQLGWKKIECNRINVSELQATLAEIDENLIRNELNALDRCEHLSRRKEIYEALYPETKNGALGGGRNDKGTRRKTENGITPFSVDTAAKTKRSRSTIEQEVKVSRALNSEVKKLIRGTVLEDRKADLVKLSRMSSGEQRKIADKIAGGAKSLKEAKKQIQREAKTPTKQAIADSADNWRLVHSPCAGLNLEADSIDCIITDPPYPSDFLPCYSDLALMASRTLKPGGSCVVMCGQSYLPEIINRISEHLTYHWTAVYLTPGGQSVQLWDRKVNTFWKPLLWFVKQPFDPSDWQGDVVGSQTNDNDKRFHDWGQSESGMAAIVDRFTYPQQTILDPFVGGGTTGVVAVKLGRLFIGADSDEKQIEISTARLMDCEI